MQFKDPTILKETVVFESKMGQKSVTCRNILFRPRLRLWSFGLIVDGDKSRILPTGVFWWCFRHSSYDGASARRDPLPPGVFGNDWGRSDDDEAVGGSSSTSICDASTVVIPPLCDANVSASCVTSNESLCANRPRSSHSVTASLSVTFDVDRRLLRRLTPSLFESAIIDVFNHGSNTQSYYPWSGYPDITYTKVWL